MTLARLMEYDQTIEDSKHKRMFRNSKRSGTSEQDEPRIQKRYQTQDRPSTDKVKLEKGGSSQDCKPTFATCGKKNYGE